MKTATTTPSNDNAPRILDMGNNEEVTIGCCPQRDGTFDALTLTASKNFRTRAGAERWLAARGYAANGAKLS